MKKLLPKTLKNPRGFTLIELLVVIAIIAILAIIGMTIYTGVQTKARDARRQADVLAITKAFEVNKVQGSTSYTLIQGTWFAGGNIPADTYTGTTPPVYSIIYSTGAGCQSITKPTAWAASVANPTANGGTPTANCTSITAAAVTAAPTGITAFQVCALLETGTAPNIYCVPNAQ